MLVSNDLTVVFLMSQGKLSLDLKILLVLGYQSINYFYHFQDEQEPEGEDLDQVDSEEYDEDEEEERLRTKRKKDSRYGGFIIDEAEVGSCTLLLFFLYDRLI